MKTWINASPGILAALLAGGLLAGCSDENETTCPDANVPDSIGDTSSALSVDECINTYGWQYDFIIDTDMNGIATNEGGMCSDAMTEEWYEEDPATGTFRQILAWDTIGTCDTRMPPPQVDGALCTFTGTHSWELIPGQDPAVRMALVEHVTQVTGDYDGNGVDDKCGPANLLEGTTTRYLVEMHGACATGTKVYLWQPEAGDDEAFPGDMYGGAGGKAIPAAICTSPGTPDPADHIPGRMICPASQTILDEDA